MNSSLGMLSDSSFVFLLNSEFPNSEFLNCLMDNCCVVSGFNDLLVSIRSAGATVDGSDQLRSRYPFAMSCPALAVAIPC